jgi:hypothetical protein
VKSPKKLVAAGIVAALVATVIVTGLLVGGSVLTRRFEPYIRKEAVSWLEKRFDSRVELASVRVHLPPTSPFRLLRSSGRRGTLVEVNGSGLIVRRNGGPDAPPLLEIRKFNFEIDLAALFESPKILKRVNVEGMQIIVPPKGTRDSAGFDSRNTADIDIQAVEIGEIVAKNSVLEIMPKIPGKAPLTFDVTYLRLESAGLNSAMKYDAVLTNPKPAGLVHSQGNFGPWSAREPGDTPLNGSYSFDHADLATFPAIAGILTSTGDFGGTLSAITARGQASIPNFRLKGSGHPVPLSATFEVLVDGGNGNTILKPVRATLGRTQFTTSGGVIRKNGDAQRTIALDVNMPDGDLRDVLTLAVKDSPLMEGRLALKSKILVPPLTGKVKEKLVLDGQFTISSGRFLRSELQSKIDALSRRGQGQPKNEEISQVFSRMAGDFRMENQTITFRSLTFFTPGSAIQLAGQYNLAHDTVDFHGSLGLDAKVSQTMTGWKRWALKPVDPFFAKNGVGTWLRIKIDGSSKSPNFGLDHSKPQSSEEPAGAP